MIQFLRGTQAALNSSQQIFPEGQPIYEKDTHQLKIGDGVNNYSGLPYIGGSSGGQSDYPSERINISSHPDLGTYSYYFDLSDNLRFTYLDDFATLTVPSGSNLNNLVRTGAAEELFTDSDGEVWYAFVNNGSSGWPRIQYKTPGATQSQDSNLPYVLDQVIFAIANTNESLLGSIASSSPPHNKCILVGNKFISSPRRSDSEYLFFCEAGGYILGTPGSTALISAAILSTNRRVSA